MKNIRWLAFGIITSWCFFLTPTAVEAQTTNSWTNTTATGKWEIRSNWSLGLTPTNTQLVFITNIVTKTVTIDAATVSSNGVNNCLTISNLTVQGIGAGINTLQLTNAGAVTPLRILNSFTLGTNAVLVVTNSVVIVDRVAGGAFIVNGSVTNLAGGQILTTNSVQIGSTSTSRGNLTTRGGLLQVTNSVIVGVNFGAQGTLTISGGTNFFTGTMDVGNVAGATGAVWLTSGLLSNAMTRIGVSGVGQMTVSNGTWISAGNVTVADLVNSQGTLTVAGGTNRLATALTVGGSATGTMWMTQGLLVVTNSSFSTVLGNLSSGVGQITISNGTWLANALIVGFAGGSRGTVTFQGGTNRFAGGMTLGSAVGATGTVWVTGNSAQLIATNNFTTIGNSGIGQMTVSNGTWLARVLTVGANIFSQGTLTVAGGLVNIGAAGLTNFVGRSGSGTIWVTGGQLIMTNGFVSIASNGVGQITVSNATVACTNVLVGAGTGGVGTWTVAAGTNTVSGRLTLGNSDCSATGTLVVAGGRLFVTNAATTAVLEVRSGTVLQTGGTLTIDQLILTNACGHFIKTSGSLAILGTLDYLPDLDADGDGMSNQYEIDNGLLLFNPNDAAADNDGDGFSNLAEFLTHTDPNNSASAMRILAIVRSGNNISVTWQMSRGTTNELQVTSGAPDGSYDTNGFTFVGSVSAPGVGLITNTIGQSNAATNFPARYYRVRLVP